MDLKAIEKALRRMVREIFRIGRMPDRTDEEVVKLQAEGLTKAVEKGFGKKLVDIDYDTPDFEMQASLQKDVWQFSGAKNYREMKAMTEALTGPDGKFRSFNAFKTAVRPIIGDHVRWLKTEYRTAITSSQMAAKWVRIQKDKELFPLLRFDAVIDDHTTDICRPLNGVIKPVDNPFWDIYYPPNHFNERSTVSQLMDGEITKDEDIDFPEIPDRFRTNVSKQGLIFPPGSSYYIDLPEDVKKRSDELMASAGLERAKEAFKNKTGRVERPELLKKIEISMDALKQLKHHVIQKHNDLKNQLLPQMDDVLKNATYLGRTRPNEGKDGVLYSHIFQIALRKERTFILVQEFKLKGNNRLKPYSFSQNEKILDNLERWEKENPAW